MGTLSFGILSFPEVPYDELARRCREVEALGFDSVWLADDLNIPGYADFEVWTLLGALARETTRIRLGTLVTAVTFRHPAFLAAQAITVDHISQGRVEVGIGAGGPPNNYATLGLESWGAAERRERMEEQVAILDHLLRGAPITYEGRHYRTTTEAMPKPIQQPRPPLIVAAHGERGLRLIAKYADGWNSLGGQPYPEARYGKKVTLTEAVALTERRNQQLDGYCHELGRDPATIRRSIAVYRPVPPDPLSSLNAFDEYVGHYAEIGINEIIFYWPPLANVIEEQPISAAQQALFERIALERFPTFQGRAGSAP
jgi:alkanesulfonate monooxygenase SsuD/methylene tetrahydromethanopterin reductase-like flavin-dependent oxidoreductase (luciferase family)